MRYALISDIHANLHALDAVLADIDARGDVEAIYHAGDLVGYSVFPNEVVARLRERRRGPRERGAHAGLLEDPRDDRPRHASDHLPDARAHAAWYVGGKSFIFCRAVTSSKLQSPLP